MKDRARKMVQVGINICNTNYDLFAKEGDKFGAILWSNLGECLQDALNIEDGVIDE